MNDDAYGRRIVPDVTGVRRVLGRAIGAKSHSSFPFEVFSLTLIPMTSLVITAKMFVLVLAPTCVIPMK
ncbi:MAG: hypothetical protein WA208_18635 [Thermoanaerobaculia bacterium]